MPTSYHVYANTGHGDPINYASPIATVSGLSFTPPALATPSDNSFAVRAFDTVTGLEESNVDAVVRVVVNAAGIDVTAAPASPMLLGVRPLSGGTCRVNWAWQGTGPATFEVYLTAGATASYSGTPAASVASAPGQRLYSAVVAGLADGAAYAVAVRASNAAGQDPGTASLPATGSATAPAGVDGLSGSPSFS